MQALDFFPLKLKLTEIFGEKNFKIFFDARTKARPTIEHDPLDLGVFKHAFSSANIGFFSFNITPENDLWGTVCIFHELYERGGNGAMFMTVWCQSGKWSFKMSSENQKQQHEEF